jgi:hypothetical protein
MTASEYYEPRRFDFELTSSALARTNPSSIPDQSVKGFNYGDQSWDDAESWPEKQIEIAQNNTMKARLLDAGIKEDAKIIKALVMCSAMYSEYLSESRVGKSPSEIKESESR